MVRIWIKHKSCPLVFSRFRLSSPFKNGEWLFRSFMRTQNGIKMVTGKLFSEFLVINAAMAGWLIESQVREYTFSFLLKDSFRGEVGHEFKSHMLHHFVLNACEVQRFRRLSCFGTRDSMCGGCAGIPPSLAPSTDNQWSAVSALEIGDIPAVLSVS